MARKFSLKDNPIFQRLEIPTPQPLTKPEIEESKEAIGLSSNYQDKTNFEGQKQTLKNRPSEFDPRREYRSRESSSSFPTGKLLPSDHRGNKFEIGTSAQEPINRNLPDIEQSPAEENLVSAPKTSEEDFVSFIQDNQEKSEVSSPAVENNPRLGLRDHIEKSLFFTFYNEVSDHLLPTLETAEQVLFARLFRLSYGFNKNYCTVSHPLLQERTGLSRNTVRTSLQSLLKKGLISIIGSGKHISTTYRVFLPREKGADFDPQKQTLKNRPSKFESRKRTLNGRGSKKGVREGQNLDLQISPLSEIKRKTLSKNRSLHSKGSKTDPQKLTPLLITNNSLTLSESELNPNSLGKEYLTTVAKNLIEDFYTTLFLSPSAEKIARGTAECRSLLEQGFTESQIHYTTTWIATHHPDTGSFSRVTHFIDQALKSREEEERNKQSERQKILEEEYKKSEEQEVIEEGKRIDKIKASLDQDELELLQREASQLVESEHGNIRFGRETLVQLKVRNLIRERFLLLTRPVASKSKL